MVGHTGRYQRGKCGCIYLVQSVLDAFTPQLKRRIFLILKAGGEVPIDDDREAIGVCQYVATRLWKTPKAMVV